MLTKNSLHDLQRGSNTYLHQAWTFCRQKQHNEQEAWGCTVLTQENEVSRISYDAVSITAIMMSQMRSDAVKRKAELDRETELEQVRKQLRKVNNGRPVGIDGYPAGYWKEI
jgi:hypothetical protein